MRSKPLPCIGGERDDCIQPLATRYGLGWQDGVSASNEIGGAIAFCTIAMRWRRGEFIILMSLIEQKMR